MAEKRKGVERRPLELEGAARPARNALVQLRVTTDEKALMELVALEQGFASVADMLRAAFNRLAGLERGNT